MRGQTLAMNQSPHFPRGRSGMTEVRKKPLSMFFYIFNFIFDFYVVMQRCTKMSCKDVRPSCPAGASPIERRGAVQEMVICRTEVDEDLDKMEENL